jgi:hypothetical protein
VTTHDAIRRWVAEQLNLNPDTAEPTELGASPRDVDTSFYAAVASVADRRS